MYQYFSDFESIGKFISTANIRGKKHQNASPERVKKRGVLQWHRCKTTKVNKNEMLKWNNTEKR